MAEGHQNHARYQRGEGRPESISSTLPVPRPYLGTSSRPAPAAVPPRTSSGSCPGCCGTGPGSRRSPPRTRPRLQQRGGSSGERRAGAKPSAFITRCLPGVDFPAPAKTSTSAKRAPSLHAQTLQMSLPKRFPAWGVTGTHMDRNIFIIYPLTRIGIHSLYIHSHG